MKNQFAGPNHFQETILRQDRSKIGAIRIKPSSVLWKPSGQTQFYCVTLDEFVDWITSPSTGARRTYK